MAVALQFTKIWCFGQAHMPVTHWPPARPPACCPALVYVRRYQRWGCLIMLLHDTTDVIMEVAKNLNYAGFDLASTSVFVLFMLSWAALRLTAFPFVLIRSTLFDSTRVLGYTPPYHGVLNALLCVLCCFHVYWFGLIVRVAVNTVKQGKSKDIRELED